MAESHHSRHSPPPPADLPNFDQVRHMINAESPEVWYRQADRFDQAKRTLAGVATDFRREAKSLDEAWDGRAYDSYDVRVELIAGEIEQMRHSPDYGGLLRRAGDALATAQRRIHDLEIQREQADKDADQKGFDEHARVILADLATVYADIGSWLSQGPDFGMPDKVGQSAPPPFTGVEETTSTRADAWGWGADANPYGLISGDVGGDYWSRTPFATTTMWSNGDAGGRGGDSGHGFGGGFGNGFDNGFGGESGSGFGGGFGDGSGDGFGGGFGGDAGAPQSGDGQWFLPLGVGIFSGNPGFGTTQVLGKNPPRNTHGFFTDPAAISLIGRGTGEVVLADTGHGTRVLFGTSGTGTSSTTRQKGQSHQDEGSDAWVVFADATEPGAIGRRSVSRSKKPGGKTGQKERQNQTGQTTHEPANESAHTKKSTTTQPDVVLSSAGPESRADTRSGPTGSSTTATAHSSATGFSGSNSQTSTSVTTSSWAPSASYAQSSGGGSSSAPPPAPVRPLPQTGGSTTEPLMPTNGGGSTTASNGLPVRGAAGLSAYPDGPPGAQGAKTEGLQMGYREGNPAAYPPMVPPMSGFAFPQRNGRNDSSVNLHADPDAWHEDDVPLPVIGRPERPAEPELPPPPPDDPYLSDLPPIGPPREHQGEKNA